MMTQCLIENRNVLAGDRAVAALTRTIEACRRFAAAMPPGEQEQAGALRALIAHTGAAVGSGALKLAAGFDSRDRVVRLFKERIGPGRLKLQLFPLGEGEAHPPHAHDGLLSCQIALRGSVRVRAFSLLGRMPDGGLEISEEPVRTLGPGDGVFTLQRMNNIHWQQGLAPGTVLLNVNWRGFLDHGPLADAPSEHGRCRIDWERARPGKHAGVHIVPRIAEKDPGIAGFANDRRARP